MLGRTLNILTVLYRRRDKVASRSALAGPEGLDAMKVDNIWPQTDRFALHNKIDLAGSEGFERLESRHTKPKLGLVVSSTFGHGVCVLASGSLSSTFGHGVCVLASGRLQFLGYATGNSPSWASRGDNWPLLRGHNMVLILRNAAPYSPMAKSFPHLRSVSDCARF